MLVQTRDEWKRRKRRRMGSLSESNLSTENEGGGEVCLIVTPAQRMKERRMDGGGVVPIFSLCKCKNVSHLFIMGEKGKYTLKIKTLRPQNSSLPSPHQHLRPQK